MIDWDDLRFFLVAARSGSFGTAAVRLNTDATTVGRRVVRLETRLKVTLFIRSASGLQLTQAGHRLLDASGKVEAAVEAAENVQRSDTDGNLRISASEGLGTLILAPALHVLTTRHPRLSVELAAWAGAPSPSRREVDMAVMFCASDSHRLTSEILSEFEVGLYGAQPFFDRLGMPRSIEDLHSLPLVGFINDMLYAPELRYLDDLDRDLKPQVASTSSRAQMEIIGSGAAIGMLPCFMAACDTRLIRLMPNRIRSRRTFWLISHEEVRNTTRYHAVRNWLFETVSAARDKLLPAETGAEQNSTPAVPG